MLQQIRERARGWVAWTIVILISLTFALFGIESYRGGGGVPVVADVDGTEITDRQFAHAVQRTRMQLRERLGAAYDPEVFGGQRLREQVLERMVREAVILGASERMGLRVADQAVQAAILREPAFQADGVFDKAAYERALQLQALTPSQYVAQLRQQLLSLQLAQGVISTEFVTDDEVQSASRLTEQTRTLSYVRLARDTFLADEAPADAEILSYYEENQSSFETPEQVRVDYVVLDAAERAPTGVPTERELRERYEARIDEFTQPERRQLRHILLTLDAADDEDAAETVKQRLAEVRKRVLDGEPFGALAEEVSEDPVSAAAGGDLGLIGRGMLDAAMEQAAFALEKGDLSEPIRSRFGYHLIEVTRIEGGDAEPFDAVRDRLVEEMTDEPSQSTYFALAERLANLTYEASDTLIPAAEELGLDVQTSDWIGRDGLDNGLFAHPRLVAAAFSEDVLARGNNSGVLEPDPDELQAVVLRVAEHREAAPRPLDAVRDEIVDLLKARDAEVAARAAADEVIDLLSAGGSLAAAAAGYEVGDPQTVTRTSASLPAAVRSLAFELPRPDEDRVSVGRTTADNGDAYVVVVASLQDGGTNGDDQRLRETQGRMLESLGGRGAFDRLVADLRTRADVRLNLASMDDDEG